MGECRGSGQLRAFGGDRLAGHVYGDAGAELRSWFKTNGIALHVFSWREEYVGAGLKKDVLYLLRPDTYLALVAERPSPDKLTRYFAERQIKA